MASKISHAKNPLSRNPASATGSGLLHMHVTICTCTHAGVDNMKHYEAYEQALQGGLTLTLRYLKFLFLGPPRSGKTSTRRRLVQEIVNLMSVGESSRSTGVAETSDVIIKKLISETAGISNSKWWSLKRSTIKSDAQQRDMPSEGDLGYLAQLLCRLISTKSVPAAHNEPVPNQADSDHSVSVSPHIDKREDRAPGNKLSNLEEVEIKEVFEKLTTILQSDSPEELQQLLNELTMINMIDVGGQPAFLEMLPALTIGPALYFNFFRLDQELRKHYRVRFCAAEGKAETVLESSYCTETVLFQSLSSIACFGFFSPAKHVESAPMPQTSSGVLLFGTHKDKVDTTWVLEVDNTLRDKFIQTKFYKENLILRTSEDKMFFPVDNMNGNESEMSAIHTDIERIINHLFRAIPIPASWLMFRLVLHLLHKPVVSLTQCETIASRLSISTPVQEALWFFHHNIGSLMHYPEIPSIQDAVICDPQVIFDSISELIIDTFKISNRAIPATAVDDFHNKGQFSLSHIKDRTEHCRSGQLSLEQLVDLLKHLNILVEIKHDLESQEHTQSDSQPRFIMPAVLKYASEEECETLHSTQVSPFMIHFESGFVPFGVFCASMAHLIAHQDCLSPKWQLYDNQVKKNKVTFSIDRAFLATLISQDQYFEIHVSCYPNARKKTSLTDICSTV